MAMRKSSRKHAKLMQSLVITMKSTKVKTATNYLSEYVETFLVQAKILYKIGLTRIVNISRSIQFSKTKIV